MSRNLAGRLTGRRILGLLVRTAASLVMACATTLTHAMEPPDGQRIRTEVLREVKGLPSLMKWVDLADPKPAGLTFEPGPQKGTLEAATGKWPEQRATRVFHGLLRGKPINPPETGFTVAFWFRLRDLERVDRRGHKRSVGGIMAVGSGYYDGWRLAAAPDSLGLSLSIGAPGKGVRTVSAHGLIQPEKWHHVVCTWDRSTARIYIDGTAQTEAVIDIPYTMPLKAIESWWGGDMVEVIVEGKLGVGTGGWWLDEKPHGPLFYLVGNHLGKFDSICIEGLPKMRAELLRNSVSFAAKADTPGRWTAEWKIPLALMCIDVEKTDFCNFNIGVCKPGTRSKTGAKLTGNHLWVAWSGTAGPNWQVWNAGRLILRGK